MTDISPNEPQHAFGHFTVEWSRGAMGLKEVLPLARELALKAVDEVVVANWESQVHEQVQWHERKQLWYITWSWDFRYYPVREPQYVP